MTGPGHAFGGGHRLGSSPRELSLAERRDWIRLARTSTVGPVAFAGLIARFGSAGEALGRLPSLTKSAKLSIPAAHLVEEEISATQDFGAQIICACEPLFPAALRAIDPPPPLLIVLGDPALIAKPGIAVIGSRNASAMGMRFARQISAELGEAGEVVVSGLARGIDTAAHNGALATGTAAVLGGGIDHIYPRENEALYGEISRQGVIIAETPIGYRASARDFPRRNRIISGLCAGVVVIEAAERSGTLITARFALEQGREVMAAPGSPLDPRTKGCNRLIRQGAALIESTQDILDVIHDSAQRPTSPLFQEPDDRFFCAPFDWDGAAKDIERAKSKLFALLSPTPTPRDELIRASGYPVSVASAALLEMELSGDIHVEVDGRVSLA